MPKWALDYAVCHWLVLYTVHFTAFCLGGRFSPDTVYMCYIMNVFFCVALYLNFWPSSPALGCTWWSCCSSHKDAPIRSSQLRLGRTVHLEFSSSTVTQMPSNISVLSWSENWTVYQSVSLARSRLFLAARMGEHNFSTHQHHISTDTVKPSKFCLISRSAVLRTLTCDKKEHATAGSSISIWVSWDLG